VGANSPSLCPTICSVMYTGMNFLPLCTAIVWPTISGRIVERRDHVFMTFFSFRAFSASTFTRKWPSMNGPFFSDRGIWFLFLHPAQFHPLRAAKLSKSAHRARHSVKPGKTGKQNVFPAHAALSQPLLPNRPGTTETKPGAGARALKLSSLPALLHGAELLSAAARSAGRHVETFWWLS